MNYKVLYGVSVFLLFSFTGYSQNTSERRVVETKTTPKNIDNSIIDIKDIDWSKEITIEKMINDIPLIENWETFSNRITLINNSFKSTTITNEQKNEFVIYKTQLLKAELILLNKILNKKEILLPIEQLTNEKMKIEIELSKL